MQCAFSTYIQFFYLVLCIAAVPSIYISNKCDTTCVPTAALPSSAHTRIQELVVSIMLPIALCITERWDVKKMTLLKSQKNGHIKSQN